jgi:hypothetical protein
MDRTHSNDEERCERILTAREAREDEAAAAHFDDMAEAVAACLADPHDPEALAVLGAVVSARWLALEATS